ncbi:flavohemoprotein [Ralstonia solanacearum]|uniref:globin domain-containing protein n=1 Tax=Ralstonia pseudosolanacearum TaxID=1310165 RepID=UPI000C9FB784|nr:globin domain-containing protein [Ralstonia pseudosolanacearum]AUS43842.1 flavohemoprotein [Ralstonia solanacearum]
MLSEQSKPLIDASVPVLREHGLTITQTFYRNMFASHPELTNLFNMGNQANGSQQQSLASAVFAYAANHGNNAALAPVVGRIVHKHAAVGIRPSHYPIVGRHLLGAIAEVLGDAATPELLAAWDEAYWLLAAELIAAEARLYAHTQSGPDHRQPVRIIERHAQAEDVVSFTLEAVGGAKLADFLPGQYISVQVELAPGVLQQRQYSLSDAPNGRTWRISVKRDAGGSGRPAGTVSNWLHDNAPPGEVLLVSQPYGDFVPQLATDSPIVLMSAGVGITPMIATLNALARRNTARKVVFSHAGQAASHVAHADDLERAAQVLPDFAAHVFLESGEAADFAARPARPGRMTVETFLDDGVADADFYLCGPLPFMQAQRAALLAGGVPAGRIHREVFGPDLLDDIL